MFQPALMQVKAQCEEKVHESFEKKLAEDEALEQATDMLHDKEEAVRLLQLQQKRLEDQLEHDKEVGWLSLYR